MSRDGGVGSGEHEEEGGELEMNSSRYDRIADGENCGCKQQTTTPDAMVANLSRCCSSLSCAIQEFQTKLAGLLLV